MIDRITRFKSRVDNAPTIKLPTLDELIGIDKFQLTESQRHDCRSLANHRGCDAAIEQAKRFELVNKSK